ncbi:hypothetical protein ER598_08520 [Salmonella enterica subsp. enterica serovar Typhimurium]|nr:hypothetical protein [Salmonella enterica subsp. enterica serovar Typhimurium]EAZ9963475.1 hypothetical protein [Salmonella enterica subsp. enterica serovar Typhimurium]
MCCAGLVDFIVLQTTKKWWSWRELNTRPKVYNILFLLKSFSLINSAYLLRIPSSPFTVFSFIPILLKMIFPFIKISSPLLTML